MGNGRSTSTAAPAAALAWSPARPRTTWPSAKKRRSPRAATCTGCRIERFWVGEYPDVRVRFLPVLCQHCHDAPCEPVCPVYASYHNPDGLNGQVYNRCVGTRYCGNNCPYAVRVFNFYDHEHSWPPPLNNQLCPDITVRSRGVMEKCTFCIQRIRRAKEEAKAEARMIRDGEVQPACAQTCPAEAMVFGNTGRPAEPGFPPVPQPAAIPAAGASGHSSLGLLSKGGGREHV